MPSAVTPAADALSAAPGTFTPDVTGNYLVVAPGDRVLLRFANGAGSITTITFDDPSSVTPESATAFNPDVAIAVPATTGVRTIRLTGDRVRRFRDPATGRINWTYSSVTTLTAEAYVI